MRPIKEQKKFIGRAIWFSAVFLSASWMTGGCRNQSLQPVETEEIQVRLEIMRQLTGSQSAVFQEICDSFTEETGIEISCQTLDNGYEEILRTRMAINDMPDIWDTHGWAIRRYSEYLRPLEDQPYAGKINPLIRKGLEDEEGRLCALPVSMVTNGIVYNKTVLREAGIDPEKINTWEELTDAGRKLRDQGVIPFAIGGSDRWSIGCCLLGMAGSYFDLDAVLKKKGRDIWEPWHEIFELLKTWREEELLIPGDDSIRYGFEETGRALGEGRAAFGFTTSIISFARQTNAEAEIGILPYPSGKNGHGKSVQIGDQVSFAVNKDTEYEEEALQFLTYLAQPECIQRLSDARQMLSGIQGVYFSSEHVNDVITLLNAKEIEKIPVFDRTYLPDGMWEEVYRAGQDLLYGDAQPEPIAEKMIDLCCGDSSFQ